MGNTNTFPSCLNFEPISGKATIILPSGATRVVKAPSPAAKLLVEFPDQLLCNADSFLLNHPLPSLSLEDHLVHGQTYLLLPSDKFPSTVLSTASLSLLSPWSSSPRGGERKKNAGCPFECVTDAHGDAAIKISREFLVRALTASGEGGRRLGEEELTLCSTPELKKHYQQLIGATRLQAWSPQLETIAEVNNRSVSVRNLNLLSPSKIIRCALLRAS